MCNQQPNFQGITDLYQAINVLWWHCIDMRGQ
jgi:hypothetical protein